MDKDAIRRDLKSADRAVKRGACEAAEDLGTPDLVPELLPLMGDADAGVREACGGALKKIGGEAMVRSVIRLLESGEECVRNLAAEVLESAGPRHLDLILGLLKVPNHDVRKFAADILGNIGDRRAVKPLIESMRDPNPNVASSAVEGLGKIGDVSALPVLLEGLEGPCAFECALAAGRIGSEKALSSLLRTAKDEKSVARYAALEAVGMIGDKSVIPALLEMLPEKNRLLHRTILKAIGRADRGWIENSIAEFKDAWDLAALVEALDETDEEMRRFAVLAIGNLDFAEGSRKLLDLLRSDDEEQTSFIVYSLVKIGKRDILWLQKGMSSDHRNVRRACATAAGDCQNSAVVPDLLKLAEDPNSDVRVAAIRAIGKLSSVRAPDLVLKAVNDEEESVRKAACDALGWIRDERAVGVLFDRLYDESGMVRDSANGAVIMIGGDEVQRRLLGLLGDKDSRVRGCAIYSLGVLGVKAALKALEADLNDESWKVRKSVVESISRIGGAGEISGSLLSGFRDNDSRVRVAAVVAMANVLKENSIDMLAAAMKDQDPWVRFRAAKCLGQIRDARVPGLLMENAEGQEEIVLGAICEVLGSFPEEKVKTLPFLEKRLKGLRRGQDAALKSAIESSIQKLT